MHILLTDALTCPRCGPEFGLVVLADSLEERQIAQGRLGCANCRASYPVRDGIADLRVAAAATLELADRPRDIADGLAESERAFRAAALLGAPPPNTMLLVLETTGALAPRIAETLPEARVVGGSAAFPNAGASTGDLSRILVGNRFPFREATFRGAALIGTPSSRLLEEVRRVLVTKGRLVVDRAAGDTADELRSRGFEVLLEQEGVVVAAAAGVG